MLIHISLQIKIFLFIAATAGILYVSWSSLRHATSHGFYRFFAWETILSLILLNIDYWIYEPLRIHQILSWILLLASLFLVYQGFMLLKEAQRSQDERSDPALMAFEKTSELVTAGVYRYIRHPMYASLLYLAWGAFFKYLSWPGVVLAGLATFFLAKTAHIEEEENKRYFGKTYHDYMKKTRRFIPFLF